jgi:hypothetical protein
MLNNCSLLDSEYIIELNTVNIHPHAQTAAYEQIADSMQIELFTRCGREKSR